MGGQEAGPYALGKKKRETEGPQSLPLTSSSLAQWVVGRADGLRVGNADPYALQKERKKRKREREFQV